MRGENIYNQIYQDTYNMCVAKLKNDNKICVYVAGYEVCALIDTGSTISVINSDLFQKMKERTKVDTKKCNRQCVVANGSNINLDTIVYVPVKIGKVTFMAELYVLEAKHIPMIICLYTCNDIYIYIKYKKYKRIRPKRRIIIFFYIHY